MDANQFQGAVVAWGAAITTLIGVLLGIALAVRSALIQLMKGHTENVAAVAAVNTQLANHEQALNGGLNTRIQVIADQRITEHRRPTDIIPPPAT